MTERKRDATVKKGPKKGIERLQEHPEPYVTVSELSEYWQVSRKLIYKQMEAGMLTAIRLGPRLLRIKTADAIEFESRAKMPPAKLEERATRLDDVKFKSVRMQKESAARRVRRTAAKSSRTRR